MEEGTGKRRPRRSDNDSGNERKRRRKKKESRKEKKKQKGREKEAKRHRKWKEKLFAAVRSNDANRVAKLIDRCSEENVLKYLGEYNTQGLAVIHVAASLGFSDICAVLLFHGVDVDSRSADESSPLHYACLNEHFETVEFLVNHEANFNIKNKLEISPKDMGLDRLLRRANEVATLRRLEREFEEEIRNEREREAQERREWNERLAQEFALEDQAFWHDQWSKEEEEKSEDRRFAEMTDEEWQEYIAAQMRKRKSEQAFSSPQAQKRQEAKEKQRRFDAHVSEKIAEEERQKEAIRTQHRAEVKQKCLDDYEEKWREFEEKVKDDSFGPQPRIRLGDIPFPDIEEDEKSHRTLAGFDVLAEDMTIEEKKLTLRGLFLRWHPDKFAQRYGQLFHPAEKEGIMGMVTRITQQIAKIKDTLNSL